MTWTRRIGSIGMSAAAMVAVWQVAGIAQRSMGPGGPGGGAGGVGAPQIELVKQCDRDGDKILNSAERKAARAFLESQAAARRWRSTTFH